MQEHPVLNHVVLGYSPVIDRQRAVVATRITVFPDRPDAAPDAADLLAALLDIWPAPPGSGELQLSLRPLDPGAAGARAASAPAGLALGHPVSLNIAGDETIDVVGLDKLSPGCDLALLIHRANGTTETIQVKCRIDTLDEIGYYRHGGILQYVLREMARAA